MWKNCSLPDFEARTTGSQFEILHTPTRYIYKEGLIGIHPDLNEYDVFHAGTSAGWSSAIIATHHTAFSRALSANAPHDTVDDWELFRRSRGEVREVHEFKELNSLIPTPWDERLVAIFSVAAFIRMDFGGFIDGRLAYPDQVDCSHSNLPKALRRVYTNTCAQGTP